jgi:hypothetical protein
MSGYISFSPTNGAAPLSRMRRFAALFSAIV